MSKLHVDHRMVMRDQHDKIVPDLRAPDFAAARPLYDAALLENTGGPDDHAATWCAQCAGFHAGVN